MPQPTAGADRPAWSPAPPGDGTDATSSPASEAAPARHEAADADDDGSDEVPGVAERGGLALHHVAGLLGAAVALAVVQAVQLAGVLAQGAAIDSSGPQGLEGDVLHRVGFAFLSNAGAANGLALVVVVALVTVPGVLGLRLTPRLEARRSVAVGLAAGLSLVLALGAVAAARARLHVLDLQNQDVTALTIRALVTYLAGTVGTAAVALGLALRATRRT